MERRSDMGPRRHGLRAGAQTTAPGTQPSTPLRHPPLPALLIIVLLTCALPVTSADPSTPWWASRQPCEVIDDVQFNGSRANESVAWQVSLGPRVPGSTAAAALRENLTSSLSAAGWEVEQRTHPASTADGLVADLVNVFAHLGAWNGTARAAPNLTHRVILAAHYDSRDRAEHDENPGNRMQPIPGANDGASGVAVLLELARLIPGMRLSHEVTLFFTDGEDWGPTPLFMGARAWADNLSAEDAERTRAFILLDMVGDRDLVLRPDRNSDPNLWDGAQHAAAALGLHAGMTDCTGVPGDGRMTEDGALRVWDDHLYATAQGIPAIDLIDLSYGPVSGEHPLGGWWHSGQDTPDKVSADSLAAAGSIIEVLLRAGIGEQPVPGDARVVTDGVGAEPWVSSAPGWVLPVAWLLVLAAPLVVVVSVTGRHMKTHAPSGPPDERAGRPTAGDADG